MLKDWNTGMMDSKSKKLIFTVSSIPHWSDWVALYPAVTAMCAECAADTNFALIEFEAIDNV